MDRFSKKESKGNDRCTPGKVGYTAKDGTSVICIGNDDNHKKDGSNNNGSGGSSYPYGSGRGDHGSIGGYSGGSSSGYSGGNGSNYGSSSSIPAHTRGLDKIYNHSDVLGAYGNTDRNHNAHSKTVANIIDYCREFSSHCWGSNALDHAAGGKEGPMHVKAINLGKSGLDPNDAANLFYVLRDFNFNLDIINLSGNNLGDHGITCMINGITSQNKQTLYKAPDWKPYTAAFNTVQNVTILILSNVNMGAAGANVISEALVSGKLPATKVIDATGNHLVPTGEGYFANALKSEAVKFIAITLEVHAGQKAVVDFLKKGSSYYFKEFVKNFKNNIDTQYIKTDEDSAFMHCKESVPKAVVGVTLGIAKCTNPIAKIINSLPQSGQKIPFVTKAVN